MQSIAPAVPNRPLARLVPTWRAKTVSIPSLERSNRHAQDRGRGTPTNAVGVALGAGGGDLLPGGFSELANVNGHESLQRLDVHLQEMSRWPRRTAQWEFVLGSRRIGRAASLRLLGECVQISDIVEHPSPDLAK